MLPPFDSGEDAVGVDGPHEGFRIGVGFDDEAIDGGLEVGDGSEHAAFEASPCELGEEAFDGVEPRCRGGREVKRPAEMLCQPFAYLRMFVGDIVVDDGMDRFPLWGRRVDGIEDLGGAAAVGRGEDDVGAPHMLLRRPAVRNNRLRPKAVCGRDVPALFPRA